MSAILGQPPATARDAAIARALARKFKIPDSKFKLGMAFPPMSAATSGPRTVPYENRSREVIIGLSVAIAIIASVTTARLYLRLFNPALRRGLDDVLIFFAALGAIAWEASVIVMFVKGGGGKHIADVTYEEVYWFFRLGGINTILFFVTVGLAAISIALFNRRITGLSSKKWQFAHYAFITIMIVVTLVGLFTPLLACNPVAAPYDLVTFGSLEKAPTCANRPYMGLALNILHILCQFSLLCVPIIILCLLQLPVTKKIRLILLFSVGSLSAIGAVMRQVLEMHPTTDFTWKLRLVALWTTIDLLFVLVAASLPVLNAAVPRAWLQSIRSRTKSSDPEPQQSPSHTPTSSRLARYRRRMAEDLAHTRPDGTLMDHDERDDIELSRSRSNSLHGTEKLKDPDSVDAWHESSERLHAPEAAMVPASVVRKAEK